MDKPGKLPGGVVSNIRNVHSRKLYIVSTAPEIGQDYWTTAIFPVAMGDSTGVQNKNRLLELLTPSQRTQSQTKAKELFKQISGNMNQ